MLKKYLVIAIFFALTACSGNSTLDGFPNQPFSDIDEKEAVRFAFEKQTYEEYNDLDKYPVLQEEKKKNRRNQIISAQLRAHDFEFLEMLETLNQIKAGSGLLADALTLSANAIGVVTGASSVKTAMHAVSLGVKGAKESIDKNVFLEKSLQIVVAQMKISRAKISKDIADKMQSKSTLEYNLDDGLREVLLYREAGSISNALEKVLKNIGKKEEEPKPDNKSGGELSKVDKVGAEKLMPKPIEKVGAKNLAPPIK